MSGFLLDQYPAGATVYCFFDSFAGATGAPSTISGFAVGDILIYKNGSTTQRASTNGYTLLDTDGIDFDSITGLNGFSVDLSDNTTAGFFAVGSQYTIVISTITVDSQTVSFVVGTFRIVAAENTAGYPAVDLARILGTALTETSGQIAAAFKKFFNVASPVLTAESVNQTGDAYSKLTATRAEPGQGAPAATTDPLTKLDYLFKAWRNKKTQTSSEWDLFNDAGSTVDQKSACSDDGTTATRGEVASGP